MSTPENNKKNNVIIHSNGGNSSGKNKPSDLKNIISGDSNSKKGKWFIINLNELILIIPDLINLFLSGFIFMVIYNWLRAKKMELYLIFIWSLFINAIIKTFYSVLHSVIFTSYNFNESIKNGIYLATATLLPFIIFKIQNTDFFRNLLFKLSRKTVHDDILDDVIDLNKRTVMALYLKNSNQYIIGTFKLKEEKGNDSYISLSPYIVYSSENNEELYNTEDKKMSALVNLKDVERIDLLYEDDSETWKWLNRDNITEEE